MKLIQILSTSPNGKIFRVRFRYGQLLNYSEWTDYVRFNSTQAVLLDPKRKHGFWDLPIDRKKKALEVLGDFL